MKKTNRILTAVLALLMIAAAFASCGKTDDGSTPTEPAATEAATPAPDEKSDPATAAPTAAPEKTTAAPTEPAEQTTEKSKLLQYEITTPADLYELNDMAQEGIDFDGCTISLNADIDLTEKDWLPLPGYCFFDTVFEGNGHTISHMNVAGTPGQINLGFIGETAGGTITFKDLVLIDCQITAGGKEAGLLVGSNKYAELNISNVTVIDCAINGYMEYKIDPDHIAIRVAALVGANWNGGIINIDGCKVDGFTATAFHNLAAFVGYDGGGTPGTFVKNSTVNNMTLTFSYTLSDSYTLEMDNKYIAIFYNLAKWPDTLGEALTNNNSYSNVRFVEYPSGKQINPEDFRSNYQK